MVTGRPTDLLYVVPPEHRDPDGLFASFRVWLSVIAYNAKLVKAHGGTSAADATLLQPTSYSGDFRRPEQRVGQIGVRFTF